MRHAKTPVLIYAPGLGRYPENTAEGVAEVLAKVIDRRRPTEFSTKSDSAVTAPKGLRVGKTVVGADDAPVLQLFELDYHPRLADSEGIEGPPPPPGVIRSSVYAAYGFAKLLRALGRPAKTLATKFQLLVGFAAVGSLVLAALVAIYAALVAAGVNLPQRLDGIFGENAAGWTFAISGTFAVIGWSAFRNHALALATTARQLIRYVRNEEARRDTVSLTVDEAIDGLRQNGWHGPIHLLGYSFGSLVMIDALFPKIRTLRPAEPADEAASLTTIGCPIDLVRLFEPSYLDDRVERRPRLPWVNVFDAADIFSSNLKNRNDEKGGPSKALALGSSVPTSIRYLDEKLGFWQVLFARGFRTHAGYWGQPDRASCFSPLVDAWVEATPAADPTPAPHAMAT